MPLPAPIGAMATQRTQRFAPSRCSSATAAAKLAKRFVPAQRVRSALNGLPQPLPDRRLVGAKQALVAALITRIRQGLAAARPFRRLLRPLDPQECGKLLARRCRFFKLPRLAFH